MALTLDYTLYLKDYVLPIGETHISTDWEVATDIGFTNIVDSRYTDTVNLTQYSNTITIPTGTAVLYARSTINTDVRSLPPSDPVVIYNRDVSIDNAAITTDSVGNMVVSITAVTVSLPGESHQSTDWIIVDTSTDSVIVSSLNDTTNLTSYTVSSSLLTGGTTYRAHMRIHTQTSTSASVCLLHDYVTVELIGGTLNVSGGG